MAYEPKFNTFKSWDDPKADDGTVIQHSLGCNGGLHVDCQTKCWLVEGTDQVDYAEPYGFGEPTLCDGSCESVTEYKGGFLYRPPAMAFKRLTCEEFLQMVSGRSEPSDNDKRRAAEHINHCGSCCSIVQDEGAGGPEWLEDAQHSRVETLLEGQEPDREFK